jgi:uncharacterized protein (TIGR03000 family)
VALALLTGSAGTAKAGFFRGPWDLSAGPYYAPISYSYNVAYGYGLPFGGYQLYNPFDPYQYPGRGAYYPRESYYSLPPYGVEPYTGPRILFRDRAYCAPKAQEVVVPALEPVPAAAGGSAAVVEVKVPARAEVWFDGDKTTQTGSGRVFRSPPLKPGVGYMYLVRAKWTEDGREVEQMQTISVHTGERVQLAFPLPRP